METNTAGVNIEEPKSDNQPTVGVNKETYNIENKPTAVVNKENHPEVEKSLEEQIKKTVNRTTQDQGLEIQGANQNI